MPQDVNDLNTLTDACSASLTKAWTSARDASKAAMKKWLLKALPRGAKRVHSWLKYDQGAGLEYLVTPGG